MFKLNKTLLKTVVWSWFVFFAALMSPLISPNFENFSLSFCAYFAFSYLILYFSLFAVDMFGGKRSADGLKDASFFFRLFLFFLILTFLFRVLDRFYFRPVDNYFSIESYRDARKAGTGVVSFLGSFLLPFFFVSMDAYLQRRKFLDVKKCGIGFFPFVLVVFIFFDLLASGSRGVVLVALVMLFGRYLSFKRIVLYAPVLILLSGALFVYRFTSLAGGEVDVQAMLVSVSSLGYSFFIPYSDFVKSLAGEGGALMGVFPFLQANQYLAHGFFEFAYIFKNLSGWFFDVVLVLPHFSKFIDQTQDVLRPGMYYTMAGTAYNAFGYASIFFMAVLGLLFGVILKSARFLGVGSTMVVLLSIFLLPFVNSFGGFDFYLYFIAILALRFIAFLRRSSFTSTITLVS